MVGITIDASTPPVVLGTSTSSPITTASFSPPANSLLVVAANSGWSAGGTVTMSISDSGSHTWTSPVKAAGAFTNGDGGVSQFFYTYLNTAPGSITVSLAYSGFGASGGGTFMDLLVFNGAAENQSRAATVSSPTQNSTDGTVSITPTTPGSWIWGAASQVSTSATTWTANAASQSDNNYVDTIDSVVLVAWNAKFFTGAPPTAVTLGGTWSAMCEHNECAFEVLPFMPPPGLILLQAVNTSNYF